MNKQYEELKEALVGDSDNWTHEELVEQALKLYDDSCTLSKVKKILGGD